MNSVTSELQTKVSSSRIHKKQGPSNSRGTLRYEILRHLKHLAGLPIRTEEVGNLLDVFILCAVATILTVRIFLWLTGYPQIGGRHLHIAHMFWGGLLMMMALILMQSILLRWARRFGAVVGGIGFGLFLDELGKFITRDNDYFFRPTFALIYVFFMIFYFGTRSLLRARGLNPQESLVNAIEFVKEAAVHPLEEGDKLKALKLIVESDPNHPYTSAIRVLLEKAPAADVRSPFFWEKTAKRVRELYLKWTSTKSFPTVLAAFFFAAALTDLFDLPKQVFTMIDTDTLGFSDWAAVVSGAISTALVVVGDYHLIRGQTLKAYRYFDRALLVAILVGQVFVFVHVQLRGILNLCMLLFLFFSVRYMIAQEERRQQIKIFS